MRATHRLAWATSLCVLLTAASNVGWSQQTDGLIPSSAEPGRALSEGIRLYRRGDFEKASDAFSKAQVTADRLSDKDQSVLNEYIDRSSRALVARHQGRMELGEAEEALSAGDAEKASELLVRAASNRFLTPDDLSHVQELETQLKSMKPKKESFWGSRFRLFSRRETSSPPEVSASQAMAEAVQIPTSPITQVAATETRPTSPTDANPLPAAAGDAKQLLREARMFMRSGLVDQAERFALAASEAKVRWDPTGDSPERILNEIQEFRAKYPAPQAVAAAIPAPTTESATPDKASALALLAEGRKRLANGELESAKEMAVRVYAMNVGLTPADGDTPEQLYSDYKRAAARKPEPDVSEKPTKADSAPSPTDQSTATPTPSAERFDPSVQVVEFETPAQTNKLDKYRPTTDRKVEAMQIMAQAQSAMNRGDHATAIQLAKKVEEMGVSFADHEPSPRRIYQAHQAIRERIEQRKQQQAVAHEEMLGRHLEMQRQRSLVSATEPEAAVESPTDNAPPKPFPASPTDDVVESAPTKSLPTIEKWSAEKPASNIEWSTDVQNVASTRPNVKPVAATVELEELAVAAGHLQDDQAESAIRQTAGPGKSAALLDAGINAMGRRDFDRAMSFFEEASRNIDSLTESQKQRLQDLTAECLTKISRDGKSRPGRRSISDDTSFAGLQEADQPGVVRDVPLSEPNRDEIAQAKERESILLQKLRQDVIEAIEQASLQLRSNPDRAIESLRTALDSVKASGLNPDQVASLVSRLESQIRQYQRARQEFVITQIEEDQQSAARDARQRTIQAELQKQNTIKQLSNRFNALMEEGSYKEAEAVAYQITEIDPDEPFGVAAMYKAQLSRRYAEIEDLEWRKQKGWWDTLQSVDESAVPIPDDQEILFPDARTWEELTKRREKYKSATLEEKSETTQRIEKSLTRPITFDFRDNPLSQVIEFIKDFTGVNVVLDLNGLEIAGVDPDEPVTLVLDNIPLKSALKLLLDPLDLTYLIKNDVLLITDKTETGTELQTLVYPVADLVIPIQNFAGGGGAGGAGGGGGFGGAGGLGGGGGGFGGGGGGLGGGGFGGGGGGFGGGGGGFGGGGGGFGGGGGGFGGGGGGQGGGQGGDISQQVIELIRTVVKAPEEWSEDGGLAEIEYFQPNRTFIVTASQATHEMLEDLLSQLRRLQDLQVSVEVRFITVSDAFFERIGIDFDVSIDNNNDEYIIQEAAGQTSPVGVPQVDNNGLGVFDGNHVRGVTVGRDPTGTRTSNFNIPIAQSSFAAATVPALAGLGATNLGGTNFGIAFLNDIDVFLLLEAVQGDQRSNTLQAPKVMLFNGQIATVEVQDLVPFVTDVTPVISAGAVTFDPTVTQIANGTQLTVQAVVSADRRFVRLTIIPQLQTVEAINDVRTVNVQGTAGGGGSVGGGISVANTAQATIQLPTVSVVRVLTTVTVPDGGTVLLGGLKSHREARNEYGTPVLSKIPYLNRLFKNASTARVTDSLMLLVSPRIIILEEEEEDLGAQTQTYGIR